MNPRQTYKNLSIKRRKFVDFMREGHNRRQSAIKAGYSEHNASKTAGEILSNPDIAAICDPDVDISAPSRSKTPELPVSTGEINSTEDVIRELTEIAKNGTPAARVSALKVITQLTEHSEDDSPRLKTIGAEGIENAVETMLKHLEALTALNQLPQAVIEWACSIPNLYEDVEGTWKLKLQPSQTISDPSRPESKDRLSITQ